MPGGRILQPGGAIQTLAGASPKTFVVAIQTELEIVNELERLDYRLIVAESALHQHLSGISI